MKKDETVAVLVEVARRAAYENTSTHPEDIVESMVAALDHAGVALAVAGDLERKRQPETQKDELNLQGIRDNRENAAGPVRTYPCC